MIKIINKYSTITIFSQLPQFVVAFFATIHSILCTFIFPFGIELSQHLGTSSKALRGLSSFQHFIILKNCSLVPKMGASFFKYYLGKAINFLTLSCSSRILRFFSRDHLKDWSALRFLSCILLLILPFYFFAFLVSLIYSLKLQKAHYVDYGQ